MLGLASLEVAPLDVPLLEPFGIASGAQLVAQNLLIRLTLDDGTVGLGEAAPFPAASGETQASTLAALAGAEGTLRGLDLEDTQEVSLALTAALPPAARAGVETALFDALARRAGASLLTWFVERSRDQAGYRPSVSQLHTDITVVTGSVEHARRSAVSAAARGFERLKVKVGGGSVDDDAARLRAILDAAPAAGLLLDANAAYSPEEALALLGALGGERSRVLLFEQPVAAEDLDGLARVEKDGRVPVAADESLRSQGDFDRLVRHGGISTINLKTAKLGVHLAHELLLAAHARGLLVMIGGMVETELSMTVSACLTAGAGGAEFVDLDTPLFLGARPLTGGFAQTGPLLELEGIERGHGVSLTCAWPGDGRSDGLNQRMD